MSMNWFSALDYSSQVYPSLEARKPRLANVRIENIVDDELMRKLDSIGLSIEFIATEFGKTQELGRLLAL
jgi:hypothetical protein